VTQPDGPIGNYYDKYGSTNVVTRRLMADFESSLDSLLRRAAPSSILDVGCGEGIVTERWASTMPQARVTGLDLESPELQAQWTARTLPNLDFLAGSGTELPFAEDEFELVSGVEMLEHVPDPEAVLAEMSRVASSHLLVSVPREPLWRALNMARGAYWSNLGNTPGHVNHWSLKEFVALCERYGQVEAVVSPLPWTAVLVRLGS
jgi:2-polyprenyl-3-methyl-5-hydroxy-6-metoxy-1,4-benzoquinol methylase